MSYIVFCAIPEPAKRLYNKWLLPLAKIAVNGSNYKIIYNLSRHGALRPLQEENLFLITFSLKNPKRIFDENFEKSTV